MNFEEQALRDVLKSSSGTKCGNSILAAVSEGTLVTITMTNGSTLVLRNLPESLHNLRRLFSWAPSETPD